jgi:hypothetical protein
MGWKSVKDHYRIGHIVRVEDKGICIGSGYVHDLIVISHVGILAKRDAGGNKDLNRYQQEMDADPAKLAELVAATDVFARSISVYTWKDAEIIEEHCEAPGWPNVTHAGHLMYENTWSTDKAEVVRWAKEDATARVKHLQQRLDELNQDIAEQERRIAVAISDAFRLAADYPDAKEEIE